MGAVHAVPHERNLGEARLQDRRAHAVAEAGGVAVAERDEEVGGPLAACPARRAEPERDDAGGARQRVGGPSRQLLLFFTVEGVPLLVGPAVHPELVAAAHDVGYLVGAY